MMSSPEGKKLIKGHEDAMRTLIYGSYTHSFHWHTAWTDNSLAKVSPTNHWSRTHARSLSKSIHAIWKTEAFFLLIMDLVHYLSESGCSVLAFILLPSSNQPVNEAEEMSLISVMEGDQQKGTTKTLQQQQILIHRPFRTTTKKGLNLKKGKN